MQVPIEEATSEARTFAKKRLVNHDFGWFKVKGVCFCYPP